MITFGTECLLVVFQGITYGVVGRCSTVLVNDVQQLRDEFSPHCLHERCPLAGCQEDAPLVGIEPAAIWGEDGKLCHPLDCLEADRLAEQSGLV